MHQNPNEIITIENILSNTEILSRVVGFITDGRSMLDMVLKARTQVIRDYMADKAEPSEIVALRASLIQFELLEKDFESYIAEYARRKAQMKVEDEPEEGVEEVEKNTYSSL